METNLLKAQIRERRPLWKELQRYGTLEELVHHILPCPWPHYNLNKIPFDHLCMPYLELQTSKLENLGSLGNLTRRSKTFLFAVQSSSTWACWAAEAAGPSPFSLALSSMGRDYDLNIHGQMLGGYFMNVASERLVRKLALLVIVYPRPYRLQCLSEHGELVFDRKVIHDGVTNRFIFVHMGQNVVLKPLSLKVSLAFIVEKYRDEILCDVMHMEATHILLGRPWQFDRKVTLDRVTLKPFSLKEVNEDQLKMKMNRKKKEKSEKKKRE
ncbi:hypothetical protein CR513_44361, partial [Mucuna pruriens]